MFSCQWPPLRDLLARMRERFPDTPILLGGEHASAYPARVLEETPIDATVTGEGEETIVEILERLDAGQSLEGVAGVTWRSPASTSS